MKKNESPCHAELFPLLRCIPGNILLGCGLLIALTTGVWTSGYAQDDPFVVTVEQTIAPDWPFSDPNYTADGSFTIGVADGASCAGTYTVNATPVAGSGPGGSTPPFTTITTYIGFPAGSNFFFGNAGVGDYLVTVTETSGCVPPVNPVQITATVPDGEYDDPYVISIDQVTAPNWPFNDPNYTADGSFIIDVADGVDCAGTYTVNATPVAGSGPGGSTPPFTTVTTYIGFPEGNFFFGNAGVGDYLVTVTETSGCAIEVNPMQITVTVPDGEYDEPFTATAANITPVSFPIPHPNYTDDGSFTITVTDGADCAGTYTVNAAPVAGSGPAGTTPPFTTVTTYIGFPEGNFLFGNAGPGDYLITVTETSGCALETNPVMFTVTVPAPVGDPISVTFEVVSPSCPFVTDSYVADGSITVTVGDGANCPGTYTVNLTPVAGSGPGGSTPPFTTVTTYIGFPEGDFLFGNAGAGDYTLTVTETAGCEPEVNPVVMTVTVPDAVDSVDPVAQAQDENMEVVVDNNPFTIPGTTANLGTIDLAPGECTYYEEFVVTGFDLCDGVIDHPGAVSATVTTEPPLQVGVGTSVEISDDGMGSYTVAITWGVGVSTVEIMVSDVSGNEITLTLIRTLTYDGLKIFCPANIIVNLDPGACNANVYYEVEAESPCSPNPPTLTQIDDSGLTSGDIFEIGTTEQVWMATDDFGNEATCSFTITVVEYPNPVPPACNDEVNISVDQNCEAVIHPDMLLEGGPYGCYDHYLVEVEGVGSGLGGVMIGSDEIGSWLNVTITDPDTDISCWGVIHVEDKIPPTIECIDVEVPCTDDVSPLFIEPIQGTAQAQEFPGTAIGPGGGTVTTQDLTITTPANALVTDVNITIDLDHTWSSDLDVFLIGPDGTTVELATDVCGSANDWENVTFDDEAAVFVTAACAGGPALTGSVQPEGLLSDFDGTDGNGTWTLMITDDVGGDGGMLNSVTLSVDYFVALPYAPVAEDACGPVDLTYTETSSGDECEAVIIERTWTATDASGNTATCVQTISVVPLSLEGVECPETHIGTCGTSDHPSVTGWPTVDGVEIVGGSVCNIFTTWWDTPLQDCGGGTKIVREWTILDWCTQEVTECTQVIKLTDDEPPVLDCPEDVTVDTDPWFCHTDVNLYPPAAYDLCETPFSFSVSVSAGTLVSFGGNYRVDDLPLGDHVVTWTATDDCGNSSTCSYTITVRDDIPPVPLCDEHTIVSLTNDDPLNEGLTKIPATVFDDGSYDNCTPVSFEARRIPSCIDFDWTTNGAGIDEIPNGFVDSRDRGQVFREYVPFACCDVGAGPVMVELRVSDDFGNVNTCMVEVEVQDKLAPYIECPPDVEVSCEFWFDAQETNGFVDQSQDVTAHVFGVVLDAYEYDESDREAIWIDDPGRPTSPSDPDYLAQPHKWGYDGWADDNCDVEITVRVRIFDDCSGEDFPVAAPHPYTVRLVERTFRARDNQGNSSTCIQRIWVVDYEPFYISDQTCVNADPNDGVIWPCDKEYSTCPDEIPVDYPTIFDDNCSLIGVTYEDARFDFVDNACYKILRTWTVIDWCQYDVQTGAGYWQHVQVIKVLDHDGAEFLTCPDGPVTLCVADPNVALPANNQVFLGESDPQSTSCSVHVRMEQTVYETCSDWVEYDVKVYPNNGSEYLQVVNKTQVQMDTANEAVLVFDTKTSALLAVRQNGLPYNDKYCLGLGGPKDYHRILWSVEDGCGNLSTCEYLFRLEDCKQPSPVCVGLSSVVMPSSGEVTIWAVDFNASSFDDCTPAEDLLYSFSGDTYMPSYSFDCDAIDANGGPSFIIEIWAADEGNDQDCNGTITWDERNKDFCTTFIVIDDNEGVCGPDTGATGGILATEEQERVEDVYVDLINQQGQVMQTYVTGDDGSYHFINPLLSYTIEPERDDNHKNGVSTLDLVRIQKHLLGLELFDSPYKYIAADANNSESVSAIDLIEIRKLILGITLEYPNNTSWRFVDADFAFEDEAHPWPFDEVIELQGGMTMNEDFVGVKVGDVNGTVVANAQQVVTRNARRTLEFHAVEQAVVAGEEVTVEVTSADFTQISGYQFTLQTDGLKLESVTPGILDMGIDNIGIHKGSVTASWHTAHAVDAQADDVLFTLTFVATGNGQLSDMLRMTSRITEAEAYASTAHGTSTGDEILDVALRIGEVTTTPVSAEFALFQNTPNPFNAETLIGFTLPETLDVRLTVFDIAGKVVKEVEGEYGAGYNEIHLKQKELGATGMLYYRLNAGDFTATKKMLLID